MLTLPNAPLQQTSLCFLGFVVSSEGVEVDEAKITAIRNWPFPMSLAELRRFLGFAGFYRRFIENFSTIACPLFDLTKKNVPFIWGHEQDLAFNELKRLLTEAPLLALPNFSKTFEIHYDASGLGIGAVLMQMVDQLLTIVKNLMEHV